MLTTDGILKLMTSTNGSVCCSKQENCLACLYSDIYRGSYMSAYVLLNLLNKLGKSDEI